MAERGGGFFSKTSRQIELKEGGKLQASCQTSAGEWLPSMLNLNFYLENDDGKVRFSFQRPGKFLESSQNVSLQGTTLSGTARRRWPNTDAVAFRLDLDDNVANIEGRLVWLVDPSKPYDSPENDEGGLGSYDASGDPEIQEYAESQKPHRPPREATITPPTKDDKQDIQNLVRLWDLDSMDRGMRQATLVTFPRRPRSGEYAPHRDGWRIDNQENGSFPVPRDGGLQYYSLAVQNGSAVYSSVLVPVGYNVGRTRIRNALNQSMNEGTVVRIAPPTPARRQPPAQEGPQAGELWVRSLGWVVLGVFLACL